MQNQPSEISFDFSAMPVVTEFLRSYKKSAVLMGPVGSAKTTACALKIKMRLAEQKVNRQGYRTMNAICARTTFEELKRTVIPSFLSIFPPDDPGCKFYGAPPMHYEMKVPPSGNEPGVKFNCDFISMEAEGSERKLLSSFASIIWLNEAREFSRKIVKAAEDRLGRVANALTDEASWYGMLMDTNPPDDDHWMAKMEEDLPHNWQFFHQPPAVLECREIERDGRTIWQVIEPGYNIEIDDDRFVVKAAGTWWCANPGAENIQNLPTETIEGVKMHPLSKWGYYLSNASSADRHHIRTYLQGRYGPTGDGKSVIPQFSRDTMTSADIKVIETLPVFGGADVGAGTLAPACVLGQKFPRGNWVIFDEVMPPDEGVGLEEFIQEVKHRLATVFPRCPVGRLWGDPAGAVRDGVYLMTYFEHMQNAGLKATPAPTNDVESRIQAIRSVCGRLIDGKPGLIIHRRCVNLIKGLTDGWKFSRVKMAGDERYKDVPDKNKYSHLCDALGYLLLGAGEHKAGAAGRGESAKPPTHVKHAFSVYG